MSGKGWMCESYLRKPVHAQVGIDVLQQSLREEDQAHSEPNEKCRSRLARGANYHGPK
jgi:hypothetical protein